MTLAPEAGSAQLTRDTPKIETPKIEAPVIADGVELIGDYEGSGFKEPPSLVRRGDGQVIQLATLLYEVASRCDGVRSCDEIAREVSQEIRRQLDADQVRFLVEEKLRPLGILAAEDGSSPSTKKADPFLALNFRAALISERVSGALGRMFQPLFLPIVVLAVLAAFVAADVWLFFGHGVAQALRQSIYHPGLFLPLFLGVVLSAAFHEIGHAAACRYGGGRPGKMGCGLYLAWPAFYTDVTDAYRLGRRARLRTDLGGVYFNVVVVLAIVGAYFLTGFEPLLLLVVIQHLEIVHQLLPVVRLDGYYIVADLTGVPDLFARIGPILRSMVPWRASDEKVTVLKPWVRAAVTAWVMIVVPLLIFELFVVLMHLPRILGTAWDSAGDQRRAMQAAFDGGQILSGVTSALELIVLLIPVAGIVLMLVKVARQAAVSMWARTEDRPVRRAAAVATASVGVVLLLFAWVPLDNYRPIQPNEKGTLTEGARAVRYLPRGNAPLYSERQAQPQAPAADASGSVVVPADAPVTSLPSAAPSTTLGPDVTTTTVPASTSTSTSSTTSTTSSTTTTAAPTSPSTTVP
jgi:putative peptide zinc metalloprotease protein